MTEIHGSEARSIVGTLDGELCLVEFHLHLQLIVVVFHTMSNGTLHILQQFIEHLLVGTCHVSQLASADSLHISLIGLQDNLALGKAKVLVGHIHTTRRHLVGSPDLAAHIEGLCEADAPEKDITHLVI